MLTCIACSKRLDDSIRDADDAPRSPAAIKTLTAQIKDMALKFSGAYRHCRPCASSCGNDKGNRPCDESDAASEYGYRAGRSSLTPAAWNFSSTSKDHVLGDDRLNIKEASSVEGTDTPTFDSPSGRPEINGCIVMEDSEESKEWIAQVEPGVLITFISLPEGGNDLKRIRFSREMFNKWQAQRWWTENYDKILELYNVQRFDRQGASLPTPPRTEDDRDSNSKLESAQDSPVTPPLHNERLPRNFYRQSAPTGVGYSSSDSTEQPSGGLAATPNLSTTSARTETSSMDASRTSSSRDPADRSDDVSVSASNASDQEMEWVEEDEPGVYITIRSLPGGLRELRRVRFSREKFGEKQARLWWEENRSRIHEQYL